jgi:hypothetical protein
MEGSIICLAMDRQEPEPLMIRGGSLVAFKQRLLS